MHKFFNKGKNLNQNFKISISFVGRYLSGLLHNSFMALLLILGIVTSSIKKSQSILLPGFVLTFIFCVVLGYCSLAYYFAFIYKTNLQLLLYFLLIYLSLISIFLYYCSKIIWANSLGKEIPWTFFKDRLLPLLLLFMPIFGIFIFSVWLHKLIFLLGLHIFCVIPLLTFWNKYRGLPDINQESNSWKHSQVYIHIALAMLYPLIFVLYFSIIRYLRLGETFDIRNFPIMLDLDLIIFSIFLLPLILYWILVVYIIIRKLRTDLWAYTASISYSIHVKMLTYQDYFFIMEKIFKLAFLNHDVISLSCGATTYDSKNVFWFRKVLSYIYYHPFILTIIFISSLCIELILNKGVMYYGIYTLFYYPLIYSIMHFLNMFGSTNFIQDVCMSDYINLRVDSLRYSEKFWIYFANPEYYYGFAHKLPARVLQKLNETALISSIITESKSKRTQQLFYRVWGLKYVYYGQKNMKSNKISEVILLGQPRRWSIRVAGIFKNKYKIRWFHTTS
jgi:hypothetical protein